MTRQDEATARTLLSRHGLSHTGLIKSDVGFRNTVWLTDQAALKMYGTNEGMAIEKWLYRDVHPAYAPALLGEGENYIIIERIHGDSLFHLWYQADECQRRQYLRQVGEIVTALQKLTFPAPNPFRVPANWQEELLLRLTNVTDRLCTIPGSIPRSLLAEAEAYVRGHLSALDDTELYPVYSDLHFDNLLVDGAGKIWLIDYEMMEAAPRDFLLDVWHRMLMHPFTYANEEDHPHSHPEDYQKITAWLREDVPALFSHPQVQARVNVYGILYELNILCDYPGEPWPTERLNAWIREAVPV